MYPADFDVDEKVRLMEDCELGLFLRCLNHSWKNDGLPSDPEDIRRCFRDDPEQFEIKWKRVQYCFPISEDGRRRNPRQEEERLEATSKSKKAKKSAKSRWACERNANALRRHCEGNARASDSDSDYKEETTKTEKASTRANDPPGYAFDEQYSGFREEFSVWAAHIVEADFKGDAWREWRLLDHLQRIQATNGIIERRCRGDDPAFAPAPAKYLKGRESEWNRPARPKPKSALDRKLEGI